jgi:hypothetical protein
LIDTEKLFKQLATKDWDSLAEILFEHKNSIHKDPYLPRVAQLFESEFFDHISSLAANEKLTKLRHISLIIESNRSSFAKDFVDRAIDEKLQALKESGDKGLASYASTYFDRPLAKQLLKELRRDSPEKLAEARQFATRIEAVTVQKSSAKTIRLFKSPQEQIFFNALREAFPHYLPYPNVAMSCVVDLNAIRESLSYEEKEYFFKAVIDFVLYDPMSGHEPLHFFELDSKFHDSEKAKRNDTLKNAIFSAAGIKLIRIRSFEVSETAIANYKKMVLDLVTDQ